MKKTLKILVTSGGIGSRIDDIRQVSNFSQGTTGALIAEEFLKLGATVLFVYGSGTKRPFRHQMQVDPEKSVDTEIGRIKKILKEQRKHVARLQEYAVDDFSEYHKKIEWVVRNEKMDAVVLAAAVADYGIDPVQGKISSDEESMVMVFKKNPKIISLVKKWDPKIFQVGFKLLPDSMGISCLIDEAYKHGMKNHSNLTVANTINEKDFRKRSTIIITPEKGLRLLKLDEVAPAVAKTVAKRISKKHYRSELAVVERFADYLRKDLETMKIRVKKFWGLNLFESYTENSDMHFGFVAMRTSNSAGGFLITTRGSNKKNITDKDIAYVYGFDPKERIIRVKSLKNKASLNANVAARIFRERSDINIIVHAHVFPGIKNRARNDFAPGTKEDENEVVKYLGNGEKAVEIPNHGIVVIGMTAADIERSLDFEPAYTSFASFYDLIYGRFNKGGSSFFLSLIKEKVKTSETILDLAAGTGRLTRSLGENGYGYLTMADKNGEMLEVAKNKTGNKFPAHAVAMENMDLGRQFDAIIIGQAVNYLRGLEGLTIGFKNIYKHLSPGGRLIFNAPNFTGQAEYPDREYINYTEGWEVKIREMNAVHGRAITHTHNCMLVKEDGSEIKKIYDLNRFMLFTPGEFKSALKEAGFSKIEFPEPETAEEKSKKIALYCVAVK